MQEWVLSLVPPDCAPRLNGRRGVASVYLLCWSLEDLPLFAQHGGSSKEGRVHFEKTRCQKWPVSTHDGSAKWVGSVC